MNGRFPARMIEEGVIVNHISTGDVFRILRALCPNISTDLVVDLNSGCDLWEKKSAIFFEGRRLTSEEMDAVSLMAHEAFLNVIERGEVKERRRVELPKKVGGVFKCLNLSCPTNDDRESVEALFEVKDADDSGSVKLRCLQCGSYLSSKDMGKSLAWRGIGGCDSRKSIETSFLGLLLKKGAVKIASRAEEIFTLKSGRPSVYFVNIGSLTDGDALDSMKRLLASYIAHLLDKGELTDFDFIFGPAYKGINLATLACEGLSELYGVNKRFLYDRKEEKDYGDVSADRIVVGSEHFRENQKILLIDDVATTGGTKEQSMEKLKALGPHKVIGLILVIDRQEKMGGVEEIEDRSAVQFIREKFEIPVFSILDAETIFDTLKEELPLEVRNRWINYYEKYGGVRL